MKFFQLLFCSYLLASIANAGENTTLQIATAANFSSTLQKISEKFHELHPEIEVKIIPGATGNLYSQIINGAPFDLFFSADEKHADLLIERNIAHSDHVSDHSFVYAKGRLCLLTSNKEREKLSEKTLQNDDFKFLAIAKPDSSPYGFAAKEVLEKLALWEKLNQKIIYAQDVGAAMTFITSENVDFGFVALSQIISWQEKNNQKEQNFWVVPQNFYKPVKQKVVLLRGPREKEAQKFLEFVKSSEVEKLIRESGYD